MQGKNDLLDLKIANPGLKTLLINEAVREILGLEAQSVNYIREPRAVNRVMTLFTSVFNGAGVWKDGDEFCAQIIKDGRIERDTEGLDACISCIIISYLSRELHNAKRDDAGTRSAGTRG